MFKDFHRSTPSDATGEILEMPGLSPAGILNSNKRHSHEQQKRLELKQALHQELLDQLNLSIIDKIEASELRREMNQLVTDYLTENNQPLSNAELNEILDDLMHEVLGLGPLEPLLEDPSVNDILVNSHENVYVERAGMLEKTNIRFRDERHLLRVIDKIVSRIGRRIDESQPWVDARLEDGSRVNAIIRPCAVDGPSMSIRKFSAKPLTIDRLVSFGAMSQDAATMMEAVVGARLNVLISGGTGSGKTTMLNALSSFIDHRQRIVTIEDAAELQLQQDHVVRLETRPSNAEGSGAVSQRDLVRNALRMRPDRVIIGEVRGGECIDMLQAMNTGHDGSMTTIHANTPRDALGRIEQMVTMSGIDFPMHSIRGQVSSAIHVVLQVSRLSDGRRRVTSISELTGMEGEIVTMQEIYRFRKTGKGEDGEVLGEFEPTGIRPTFIEELEAAGYQIDRDVFMAPRVE